MSFDNKTLKIELLKDIILVWWNLMQWLCRWMPLGAMQSTVAPGQHLPKKCFFLFYLLHRCAQKPSASQSAHEIVFQYGLQKGTTRFISCIQDPLSTNKIMKVLHATSMWKRIIYPSAHFLYSLTSALRPGLAMADVIQAATKAR